MSIPTDHYDEVERAEFASNFRYSRTVDPQIRKATSAFQHVEGTRYFLGLWKQSGYAIRPDGELVLVHSTVRGRGADLVAHAIANGAKRLDCFDGYLVEFYSRHGFVEYERHPNWTAGEPDVVYMALSHLVHN